MARTDAMSVEPGGWVGVPGCCLLLFCIWVTTSFNCSDRRVWFQKGTALPLSSSISNEQRFLRSHAFTQSCNKFSAVLFHNLLLQTAMFCNNSLAFLRTKLCVFSRSDDKLRSGFVLKACAGHCAQCAQCAQCASNTRPPSSKTNRGLGTPQLEPAFTIPLNTITHLLTRGNIFQMFLDATVFYSGPSTSQ